MATTRVWGQCCEYTNESNSESCSCGERQINYYILCVSGEDCVPSTVSAHNIILFPGIKYFSEGKALLLAKFTCLLNHFFYTVQLLMLAHYYSWHMFPF